MAKINEIDITSLLFQEGSAPTTPASTKWRAYFKTDGLYVKDDAGTETGPLGTGGGGGGTFSGARISDPSGADQAIGVGTATEVTFDTEDFDTDGYATLGSNAERLTIPADGYYILTANIVTTNSGGRVQMLIYDGGLSSGTPIASARGDQDVVEQMMLQCTTGVIFASSGDFFSVAVTTDGADMVHASYGPWFSIVRVGTT